MKDHYYLSLQFKERIYSLEGTEFQNFFADVMELAFPDYKRIKPSGRDGDGGNDGYRPSKGIYYQVYSPRDPKDRDLAAANKFKEDFEKLKATWDKISEINEYYFAYNDKWTGSSLEIEKAISILRKQNPLITFDSLTPIYLEKIFLKLDETSIKKLKFDIDTRKSVKLAVNFLDMLEKDLDRDFSQIAMRGIESLKESIDKIAEDSLTLEYELLFARALQKGEKVLEARKKLETISKLFPDDFRAKLLIAELELTDGNFDINAEILSEVNAVDPTNPHLLIQTLIRQYTLSEYIPTIELEKLELPEDSRCKSNIYRLFALMADAQGDYKNSDKYIEKAIYYNPDKLNNLMAKIAILENRLFNEKSNKIEIHSRASNLLSQILEIEQKFNPWSQVGNRNKAIVYFRQFSIFRFIEDYDEIGKYAKNCFDELLSCYFDKSIEELLINILTFGSIPDEDLRKLITYLEKVDKKMSEELNQRVFIQFAMRKKLFSEGKIFFTFKSNREMLQLIDDIETKNFNKALELLKKDWRFALLLSEAFKEFPEFRRAIIQNIPKDQNIDKEVILMLINADEGDIDQAFKLLKEMDLSTLNYLECNFALNIAIKKEAWEFAIKLINLILPKEKKPKFKLKLLLELFNAHNKLDNYSECLKTGIEILENQEYLDLISKTNKEILLLNTTLACFKRGEYKLALKLIEEYSQLLLTPKYIIGLKTEAYIRNDDAKNAINSIIEGLKLIKKPSAVDYGMLFYFFVMIGNMVELNLDSEPEVTEGSFVKLNNQEDWYFIGNENELDATKIDQGNSRYNDFLGKKVGQEISYKTKYRSDNSGGTIEFIFLIEKYIHWQSLYQANRLTKEGRWDMMELIDVPPIGNTVDPSYIIQRLKDERRPREEFFKVYSEKLLPLAALALSEGFIAKAIATIVVEQKGYVNFSTGDLNELNTQKKIAGSVIDGAEVYIDGSAALALSESSVLKEVYEFLPNLKIPHSVITMLFELKDKFSSTPGQNGYMGIAQGELRISQDDSNRRSRTYTNFHDSITLLESRNEYIEIISAASKNDSFSEQKIQAELVDACVLAQKYNKVILTDDFLYLTLNSLETKKPIPQYTSSYAIVRTLYERKKISFEVYLNYFSYLSWYRYRFLPIKSEDLEIAVFGDDEIKIYNPQNILKFNFPLTLSKSYGVPFERAALVIIQFLVKLLRDDSVTSEMLNEIFEIILDNFPTEISKTKLGNILIKNSVDLANSLNQKFIVGTKAQSKIDKLEEYLSKLVEF